MTGYRDPFIGKTFLGRYRVVDRVAKGGMGVVYLGRAEGDAGFRRPVVVKVIAPELGSDADVTGMFLREAKVLARLQHPNIVSILDYGHEHDVHVMVLEYVRGYSLGAWYRYVRKEGSQTPVDVACFIMEQVLEGLAYVHGVHSDGQPAPVIHRDISPSNILIDSSGHVKLVDFGIAKGQNDDTGGYKTTDDASVKGKFAYMAPELFRSQPATPQTDLYACGVVLREILVGRNDLRGRDVSETIQRVMRMDPDPVGHLRADVTPALDAFLAKATAKRPSVRFRTARDMLRELRAIRSTPREEVEQTFREQVVRDFEGALPERMAVKSLDERDAIWKEMDFDSIPPQGTGPLEPAVRDRSIPVSAPPPAPTRSWALVAGLSAITLAAAAVIIALLLTRPVTRPGPTVTVAPNTGAGPLENDPTAERVGEDLGGDEPLLDATGDQSSDATRDVAASAMSRPTPTLSLRHALAQQQHMLKACFVRHPSADTPRQVLLRARVGREGRVEAATVLTPTVANSALGGCLVAAAHQLSFEPQREPVTFRIPLNTH